MGSRLGSTHSIRWRAGFRGGLSDFPIRENAAFLHRSQAIAYQGHTWKHFCRLFFSLYIMAAVRRFKLVRGRETVAFAPKKRN